MQEVRTNGHADPAQTVEESRPEQGSAEAGTLDEASTLLERREVGRGRFKVDQLGEDRLALEREEELAAERRQAPVDPRLAVDTDELRVRSRRDVEEWRLWLPECEQAGDLRLLAAHEIGELEFLAARANARNEVDGRRQRVVREPPNPPQQLAAVLRANDIARAAAAARARLHVAVLDHPNPGRGGAGIDDDDHSAVSCRAAPSRRPISRAASCAAEASSPRSDFSARRWAGPAIESAAIALPVGPTIAHATQRTPGSCSSRSSA